MSREMPGNSDIDAMIAPFGETAIVSDEGKEMRGLAAIRKWMTETNRKYRYTVDVTGVATSATGATVACRLSGDFPGSPADVSYAFALNGAKIASLEIS